MNENKQSKMITAVVIAAILIAGSLVFLGVQMGGSGSGSVLDADIEKSIEAYVAKQEAEANKPQVVSGDYSDDDAFLGDPNAPVTIVEFSDFQCPYCERFFDDTFEQIKEAYIDTGKVKFVYRDYPLSSHEGAYPAALAAECAGDQDSYFEMHDAIFENQSVLSGDSVNEELATLAKNIDLNMNEFEECYESDKYKDEIFADMADGQKAGITGTPGFIINGQILSGAQPFENFKTIIERELSNN